MQFSLHFESSEFERDGDFIPSDCLDVFKFLCQNILEPIRAFVGRPLEITSGYRSPESNAAAHGVKNSEHIATARKCAADFTFTGMPVRAVFDWIRNNTTLPFHQAILEHGATDTIIHISFNADTLPVRQALEGAVHNASPYTAWDIVAYELPESTVEENV